jgi:hypothetical protein
MVLYINFAQSYYKYCTSANKIKKTLLLIFVFQVFFLHMYKKITTFANKLSKRIMSTPSTHYAYQEPAIEFATVAVQLCLCLEQIIEQEKSDFIEKMLRLLPLLYLKARLLPKATEEMEGYPERFVTESEYEEMRGIVAGLMGGDDAYLEVFVEDMRYSDEPITAFISENIADIYQEIKDLACNYQTREEAVMNDALVSCLEGFEQHWGQKLLNVLRPLHALAGAEEQE